MFTGILGSSNSLLGDIVLGAGPAVGTDVVSSIVVDQSIDFSIEMHLYQRMTAPITVGQTIQVIRDLPRSITSEITVSPDVTAIPSPYLQLEQEVVEVLYVGTPQFQLEQYVVEVLYRRAPIQHVTSSISVDSQVSGRNPIVSLSVTSSIGVSEGTDLTDRVDYQPVTSSVAVGQTLDFHSTAVHLSVASDIHVGQTITSRNTVVRIGVTSGIGVGTPGSEQGVDNQSVSENVTVAPTVTPINNHIWMGSPISVAQVIQPASSAPRWAIESPISVTGTASATSDHLYVQSGVSVGQVIECRSDNPRLGVASNVQVQGQAAGYNSNNVQNVVSTIQYMWWRTEPIPFYINPVRISQRDRITVDQAIIGHSPEVFQTVTENILVRPSIATNQIWWNVVENVTVYHYCSGIDNIQTVTSNVSVGAPIYAWNAINRQVLQDRMRLSHAIGSRTPYVDIETQDDIYVQQIISYRTVAYQKLADTIFVGSLVRQGGTIFVALAEPVSVGQAIKHDPTYMAVQDNVLVSQGYKFDPVLRTYVTVDQDIRVGVSRKTTHQLNLTQTVIAKYTASAIIRHDLNVNHSMARQVAASRIFRDQLDIHEGGKKSTGLLFPPTIILPPIIATMTQAYISLQSDKGKILLPPPRLQDGEQYIDEVVVKRSMNGLVYTFIKNAGRIKLSYTFRISTKKAIELRSWLINNVDQSIRMVNWKGETWEVYFDSEALQLTNAARWFGSGERVEVTIDFEGIKLA